MTAPRPGRLLRIFVSEGDHHQGVPLYEWLVNQAQILGLAGATVLRGMEGYGAHSRVHKARILRMSTDLPIIVEIVDLRERIDAYLAAVEPVIREGLATLLDVEIRRYGGPEG
jgi:hypothetical protein